MHTEKKYIECMHVPYCLLLTLALFRQGKIFSRPIFVLFKSHGINICLALNVYIYTALYVLVCLYSFYALKMCMH